MSKDITSCPTMWIVLSHLCTMIHIACWDLQTIGSDRLIAHFGLLPIGVGKCQHLLKWFGKSPKWKRSQAFFGMVHARIYW